MTPAYRAVVVISAIIGIIELVHPSNVGKCVFIGLLFAVGVFGIQEVKA